MYKNDWTYFMQCVVELCTYIITDVSSNFQIRENCNCSFGLTLCACVNVGVSEVVNSVFKSSFKTLHWTSFFIDFSCIILSILTAWRLLFVWSLESVIREEKAEQSSAQPSGTFYVPQNRAGEKTFFKGEPALFCVLRDLYTGHFISERNGPLWTIRLPIKTSQTSESLEKWFQQMLTCSPRSPC